MQHWLPAALSALCCSLLRLLYQLLRQLDHPMPVIKYEVVCIVHVTRIRR